ncbi:MAG: hypothetical protein ACE5Q6_14800 [Dehalococcoidia bacterium]
MRSLSNYIAPLLLSFLGSLLVWLITNNIILALTIAATFMAILAPTFLYFRYKFNLLASTTVPFTQHVGGSHFEFRRLAETAKNSIFIVGPNLQFLVTELGLKELLFSKLADPRNPGFSIRILITDPQETAIREVMSFIRTDPNSFQNDLTMSFTAFQQWQTDANGRNPQLRLTVRKTKAITIWLLFIDADDPRNAQALVTPIPWHLEGDERPCFLIHKRRHTYAFNRYYDNYNRLFNEYSTNVI